MPGDLNTAASAAGTPFFSKSRTDERAIEQARAAAIPSLIESYGIAIEKRGNEWFALCPFHNEKSPSFTVNTSKGFYHCFGCGAHGDSIDFVQEFEGVGFRDAVMKLTGSLPVEAKPRTKREVERQEPEEWVPMNPVPVSAPVPKDILNRKVDGKWHKLVGKQRWEYRNADASLIGYVYRFDKPGGGKEIMPQVYCTNQKTGEIEWRWLSFPKPRPIYGLDKLATNPNALVIVVEGEKACDAAQALFIGADIPMSELVVVSWPGGGKAVKHVDLSPLYGRKVGLWPDADQKTYVKSHPKAGELMPFLDQLGTVAMLDIFDGIKDTCGAVRFFLPPAGVPDGWDLADDLPADFDLLKHVGAESGYAMNAADVRAKFSPTDPAVSKLVDDAQKTVAGSSEWARGKVAEVTTPAVERDALAGPLGDDVDHGYDEQAPIDRVPGSDDDFVDEPVDQLAVSVGQPARDIANAIASRLADAIGIDPADERLGINLMVIDRMVSGSFWSGSKSKVFLLNEFQNLNQFLGGDAYKFLVRAFGEPMDAKAIGEMTERFIADRELTKQQARALRGLTAGAAGAVIVDHLKYCNQRESVEWRCDMFAGDARMHLLEDKAQIVLSHKPFEVGGSYEQSIVDDYKQHFTRFDEFLQFLVQSRFALDRKKCYLWILADSDWGKGFLLGVLGEMGLAVCTSMTEIEAMFDGKPVGRAPEEFKRAFALVVDEFKTVKSELKQLQSKITLSPKNQLTSQVEVFAKLFLSAESVASLVTSHGVEDQFANRMSVFQETGTLVQRPLYLEVGNPRYFASVLNYAAETMNRMVAEMQSLGLEGARTGAERWINGFIGRYGLDTLHDRFSDSLPDVAADVLSWLYAQPHLLSQEGSGEHSKYYLPSANKVLDTYLNEHFDVSEVQTYRRRKPEILRLLSTDGKGLITRKPNGKHTKCVALMRPGCSGEDLAARRDASPTDDSEEF